MPTQHLLAVQKTETGVIWSRHEELILLENTIQCKVEEIGGTDRERISCLANSANGMTLLQLDSLDVQSIKFE